MGAGEGGPQNSVMPKGVEHKKDRSAEEQPVPPQNSVMPKGVEHASESAAPAEVNEAAKLRDAERR